MFGDVPTADATAGGNSLFLAQGVIACNINARTKESGLYRLLMTPIESCFFTFAGYSSQRP